MKTYNTYQEAKIANPECDIYTIDGVFFAVNLRNSVRCKPEKTCMTVEYFLSEGLEFVEGDLILDCGNVFCVRSFPPPIGPCLTVESSNTKDIGDSERYILRAAALENQMNIDNLATQTPEEKEALDLIDTTPHQYEMSKFSGNEWSGEGLPPVGALCKVNRDSFTYRVMYSSSFVVIIQNLDNDNTTAHGMDIILDLHKGNYTFSKPESPQQREERERLEAAYDLYVNFSGKVGICTFEEFVIKLHLASKWLAIVDKTNYRKESN